ERHRDGRQRVAYREARVRVRAGVDHYAIHLASQAMNGVDDLAFAIVLREADLRADLVADRTQRPLDVRERLASIQRRLARAEEIEIGPVDDRDLHVFFRPLSQLLNCAMSSPGAPPLPELAAGSVPLFGGVSPSSSEKN